MLFKGSIPALVTPFRSGKVDEKAFVALVERLLPKADRLEITHVHASPEGDAYFPRIEPSDWREVNRVSYPAGPDDDAAFDVATYLRS